MTSLDIGRRISRKLLHSFFTTQQYPYTKHHIDSFDQFLSRDLLSILSTQNPILILKDLLNPETGTYRYKVEIFVGGLDGKNVEIGTPVVSLENGDDVRVLFPNEARLRNLTYAAQVRADMLVRITYIEKLETGELTEPQEREITFQKVPLFKIPIMLHSRFCHLNGKPKQFLHEAGECPYDAGGYFIIDGSEKVLVTRQEPAFNTLYISKKPADPKISIYASVSSLSPETRIVKRVAFAIKRSNGAIYATVPFVRKPVNVFVLFRAMGIQSDEAIMRLIFPDPNSAEARFLEDKLIPTITDAYPFLTTTMAIQYMKSVTKGFTEFTILDVLKNQLFIHVADTPGSRANYLAECVRNILRVEHGFDDETSRDDIRNQRCLVSGFSIQMLFNGIYSQWKKEVSYAVDLEYNWNTRIYSGLNFANIFSDGNRAKIFKEGLITEKLMKAFKGKWGTGLGEEKDGLLQMLSRLSYLDFMSHCRRVVLAFDTSMKLTGPRHLHPSQFGYFCTNETPGGASIGITKNLSILTTISTGMQPERFIDWLRTRGGVLPCSGVTPAQKSVFVPVALNNGIIGYTADHKSLLAVLKAMKHTGFLPPFVSLGFNYKQRRLFIFTDEGRPLRPLIIVPEDRELPTERIAASKSWRDLIIGTHPDRVDIDLSTSEFKDPFESQEERRPSADDYLKYLLPHAGIIEYVDPYEHNEAYVACFKEHIVAETTHMEVHPSTMMSLMTSMIPFANHNQSPRNQLSCSQSKQGLSIYATNWKNRYDNSVHILCSGEAPLTRTLYYDYSSEGKIPYGNNCILALAMYQGYNQEDGIVFNKTALDRGLFRSVAFRSYEFFEENDDKTGVKTRIGNPASIAGWTDIRPGLNYMKLDERGIIKVGEYVDEDTVIIGGYIQVEKGKYKDASMTPKVWTSGIVESVNITVNNNGLRLVKVRVVQDRQPELGDKFCLTPDHEVLTTKGWKSIADINELDNVCTLGEDNKITYSNPTGLYSFNCIDEELYHLKSQQVELITTMNHKMYIKKRNAKEYSLTPASEIIGKRVQYKKDAKNINTDYTFSLPVNTHHSAKNPEMNMEAFLEFLGYWISDGWVSTSSNNEHRIELSLGKLSDIEHVSKLVKSMGYNSFTNSESNKLYISSQPLGEYLKQFSNGAANQVLPEWVWLLSENQCRTLLKGLIGGDGTVTKSGSELFFTTSNSLADQFQRLCLHAGWSSNKVKVGTAGTKIIIKGKHTQLNNDYWCLGINKSKNSPMVNHGHCKTQNGQSETIIKYTGSVHCIEVPSHIFYVRHNGKCVWTGNSNRHGQKGTMGMMIRSEDMPRSASGIVPDIIVNPHSIPSRMTMAQLLEQQLGKLAAIHGGIGEATPFMNDGNPAETIGGILENQYGYERYGNEILYDGLTGKQMEVAIFIGPIYTMRLKHMVEDKWQARTTGRKEVKTHQPTGGRGNEGGLRIGEMDRDTILCHGIAGFVQESYMKRSDGTKMPICTGCGTIPIFNQKLGIAVCSLCQGPVRFAGHTAESLEMIPPIKKQTAPIVQVEIPYVLKVLDQELATFMNTGLRFMTTSGVQKLDTTKVKTDETAAAVLLPERRLFDMEVPMFNAETEEAREEPKREVVPNLSNLAALAKQAGLALVPEGSVMTREIPKQVQAVEFNGTPSNSSSEEKIVEGSESSEETSEQTESNDQEVQIVPGAIPTRVLGSKAPPPTAPQIIPATPALTQQQLASVLVNTAVQQPALLATAAAAAQQQMMPTGPAIVVDTTPRAMTADGLGEPAVTRPAGDTLRVRREKPRVSFKGGDTPAPSPTGIITINKLG